jgi:hypothetical protein
LIPGGIIAQGQPDFRQAITGNSLAGIITPIKIMISPPGFYLYVRVKKQAG